MRVRVEGDSPKTRAWSFAVLPAGSSLGVPYGEILGAHIIGEDASELIAEVALAKRLEATAEDIISTMHAHPTMHEAMHEAAQTLVGHHDFTTFRSAQCQSKSPVKTLDRLDVAREGDEIAVYASARSFLHNQVRSLVGTLKLAGEGKWLAGDVRAALEAADRSACGPVAPPDGLYLAGVSYPRDPFAGLREM